MILYKLLLNKVDGKVYGAISSMYKHSVSCIRINDKLTEWFDCQRGLKQGNNLSPTIFSIFINDLVPEVNDLDLGIQVGDVKVSMLLYADDIVFVSGSEAGLQGMLDQLHEWCKKWRVLINTDKSKCMHFRHGRTKQTEYSFKVGNMPLELVECYKYLGVFMHDKRNFTTNSEALAKGAGRALGSIISKVHHLKHFGFNSYTKLYNSCVIPIMDYCSSIWGYKQQQSIDNVQNRALRYFLGVHRFTPTLALTGDSGWLPSMYRRWTNMLRYWNRLVLMEDHRLTKRVFNADYNSDRANWCKDIKSIMTSFNLLDQYNSKMPVSLTHCKSLSRTHYYEKWLHEVKNVAKLRTYQQFKCTFECEQYLNMDLQKNERSIMAQFRCGTLPLRIETGRFVGEKPEQRLCIFCNSDSIESELHFLVECGYYDTFRTELLKSVPPSSSFQTFTGTEKLVYLMNNFPRQVARYLVKAYMKRRSTIYCRN